MIRIELCLTITCTLLICMLLGQAHIAVMITHSEVAQRALAFFASERYPIYEHYAKQHQDALQAGCIFPDWGYQFGYGDESEAAHWDPFIEAAADYLRTTYPKPWDLATEKLAVFLLGIMCHSAADMYWHSLGVSQGFLEAMAAQDFFGNFSQAHTHGDVGGDVVLTYERDLSCLTDTWYVPVLDMARLYNLLGFERVNPKVLTMYTFLLFLATHVERSMAGALFPAYAGPSPFLVEEIDHYFVGGLEDMALRSMWRWEDVIEWIEQGIPSATEEGSLLKDDHPLLEREREIEEAISIARAYVSSMDDPGVTIEKMQRGVVFRIQHRSKHHADMDTAFAVSGSFESHGPFTPDRVIVYETHKAYAYLGKSLDTADLDNDGRQDLVMGAPGYGTDGHPLRGAVYVASGRTTIGPYQESDPSKEEDCIELVGSEDGGRFGWSLATVDINADGIDDIAIAAPTTGSRDLSFTGTVYVYFGRGCRPGISPWPDMTITGLERYTVLGWSLSAGDCDGDGHKDLIIGSPLAGAGGYQRGMVAVFLSSRSQWHAPSMTVEDADMVIRGNKDYDWYGYHAACMTGTDHRRWLVVSAPSTNSGEIQGSGTLYGYELPLQGIGGDKAEEVVSIAGTEVFDRVGFSFVVSPFCGSGEDLVALSMPTRSIQGVSQAGSVLAIPLEGLSGDMRSDEVPVRTAFLGTQQFARAGWAIGCADFNNDGVDDLWITEPWKTTRAGVETGAAYLWLGGTSFPVGTVPVNSEQAFWYLSPGVPQSLFGSAIAFPDVNGDGSVDTAIAAPRSSSFARCSGAVYLFVTPAPSPSAIVPNRAERGSIGTFTITGERFLAEGLAITLAMDAYEITASTTELVDATTLRCELSIPDEAPLGMYAVRVKTLVGTGSLEGAFQVVTGGSAHVESRADQSHGCGCAHVTSGDRPTPGELCAMLLLYAFPWFYTRALRRKS